MCLYPSINWGLCTIILGNTDNNCPMGMRPGKPIHRSSHGLLRSNAVAHGNQIQCASTRYCPNLIILAMGRFAVQSLLRSSDPIGKLRGRVHHYQGVPLIVTYHPAYFLRNLEEKARAWDDLCLAAQTYDARPSAAQPLRSP